MDIGARIFARNIDLFLVAPWLQKSSKTQIIHGIIGIAIQYIVSKENLSY